MKIKHKLQVIFLIVSSIFLTIFLINLVYIQKPERTKEAIEKKQRIVIPFQKLKNKYATDK